MEKKELDLVNNSLQVSADRSQYDSEPAGRYYQQTRDNAADTRGLYPVSNYVPFYQSGSSTSYSQKPMTPTMARQTQTRNPIARTEDERDEEMVSDISELNEERENEEILGNQRKLADVRAHSEELVEVEKDMTHEDKEELIEIVRQYPMLWMVSHPEYKEKSKKKNVWYRIHEILDKKYTRKHALIYINNAN